jgi:hypothetical protein
MKTIKLLILASLVIFFMQSCKENEDDKPDKFAMPPLTSMGANTMGCFINGNPFVADVKYDSYMGGGKTSPIVNYWVGNIIDISGKDYDLNQNKIILKFNFNDSIGDFDIPDYTDYGYTEFIDFSYLGGKQYRVIMDEPHWVKVSGYKENEFISGTFRFTGVNKEAGDTVRITNGRFDIAFE